MANTSDINSITSNNPMSSVNFNTTIVLPLETSSSSSSNLSGTDTAGFALSDLLSQLEEYIPTIPDSITKHLLLQGGCETSDNRLDRLISICGQKMISDIVNETYTHVKLKATVPQGGKAGAKSKQEKKIVLTQEDLLLVLNEYGITVKKPPYYL